MNLSTQQQANIDQIAQDHNLKIMVVFGSQINGQTHQSSDLDVGILLNQKPSSYHQLLDIKSNLQDIFPNYELDVNYLHNATPYFLFEAVYKGKLLYGSSYDYAKLSAKAFKQYVDTQPLRDLRDEIIKQRQLKFLH